MSYKPPGVRIIPQRRSQAGTIGSFLPTCIIADGADTLEKTFRLTRGTGAYDIVVDRDGNYANVETVLAIGDTDGRNDYTEGALEDYELTTQVVDGITVSAVTWVVAGDKPETAGTYYLNCTVFPPASHYELKLMAGDPRDEYGPNVIDGAINNISLAVEKALISTSSVYAIKVKKAGALLVAADVQATLDKIKTSSDTYRIVWGGAPDSEIANLIANHVRVMSSYDEQKERVGLVAAEHDSSSSSELFTNVGGFASALADMRMGLFYPDKAKTVLDDGKEYIVHGGIISASIAGMKSSLRPEESYTGKQIQGFNELVGVGLTRPEKNILAGMGVMLLDQDKAGFPIIVRHGLSTDMSSIQSREISIVEISDHVSRAIRSSLTEYKGQTINSELISKIEGTASSVIDGLVRAGHINSGSRVEDIYQIEESPDSIAIKIRVNVPYPCNYIEVMIAFD